MFYSEVALPLRYSATGLNPSPPGPFAPKELGRALPGTRMARKDNNWCLDCRPKSKFTFEIVMRYIPCLRRSVVMNQLDASSRQMRQVFEISLIQRHRKAVSLTQTRFDDSAIVQQSDSSARRLSSFERKQKKIYASLLVVCDVFSNSS